MSEALRIMKQHLSGRDALGQGSWNYLIGRGWHPQQITKLGSSIGKPIGEWAQSEMGKYPNASRNVGASGLYNIGAAQGWVGKGKTQDQIQASGSTFANTPRGRATGRSGWQAGFTSEAVNWLNNQFLAQEEEVEGVDFPEYSPLPDVVINMPDPAPLPGTQLGQANVGAGYNATGVKTKQGSDLGTGGTRAAFGREKRKRELAAAALAINPLSV